MGFNDQSGISPVVHTPAIPAPAQILNDKPCCPGNGTSFPQSEGGKGGGFNDGSGLEVGKSKPCS